MTNMSSPMPLLFVGHGSPMNAIEDNAFHRSWRELGQQLPRPRAILCISAHWQTPGVFVTGSQQPETIYDFYGFPQALFDVRYPSRGDPALARHIADLLVHERADVDTTRGLDHGVWSVLCAMYPKADIPVLQLSLDRRKTGADHYRLAQALMPLRDQGVLIIASGNIAHNLSLFRFHDFAPLPWAQRFRDLVNTHIAQRSHAALCDYPELGVDAALAINSAEHYLPLLYALGLQRNDDEVIFFNDEVLSAISMTSLLIAQRSDTP